MFTSPASKKLLTKIQEQKYTVGAVFEAVFQGIVTGADDIYFLEKISTSDESEDIIEVFSHKEKRNIKIEKAIIRPMLKGEDVTRYVLYFPTF